MRGSLRVLLEGHVQAYPYLPDSLEIFNVIAQEDGELSVLELLTTPGPCQAVESS